VIEHESAVVPIEVKSQEGSRIKSLRLFMEARREYVDRALKISSEPFGSRDFIETWPFYAIANLYSQP
jgi:hypothetical protein